MPRRSNVSAKRFGSVSVSPPQSLSPMRSAPWTSKRLGPFQYSPLAKGCLRLLTILPGFGNESLECELSECTLTEAAAHTYGAVSYAWGRQCRLHQVSLNGRSSMIPESAFQVLCVLRERCIDHPFWIDAICIDQTNDVEKGVQVQHMHQIYAQAAQVLVWTGHESADIRTAFNYLSRVETWCRQRDIVLTRRNVLLIDSTFISDLASTSNELLALMQMFSRPCFSRSWILQELLLNDHTLVLCGNYSCDLNLFLFALRVFNEDATEDQIVSATAFQERVAMKDSCLVTDINSGNIRWLRRILDARERRHVGVTGILYSTRALSATDPRDYIYSIHGLLKALQRGIESSTAILETDYSISVAETYIRATVWSIRRDKSFSILWLAGRRTDHLHAEVPAIEGLPGWVMDFSQPADQSPFGSGRSEYAGCITELYLSSEPQEWLVEGTDFCHDQGSRVLSVHGTISDTITESCPYMIADSWGTPKDGKSQYKYDETLIDDFCSRVDYNVVGRSKSTSEIVRFIKSGGLYFARNGPAARTSTSFQIYDKTYPNRPMWRHLALTESGRLVLVLWNARTGDKLCFLPTVPLPLVVRPVQKYGMQCHELICEGFAPDLMADESLRENKEWIQLC